jgi:hypothetical protein
MILQLGLMLNPAKWLWFNPEEVVRIYSKHRFRPKGKFRGSEFGLSEKAIDSPGIAAEQIEEFWKLCQ